MNDARFALIVANSRYQDKVLRQLRAPGHDARALSRVLGDPAIGGFDVKTAIDRPAASVMQDIEAFFDGRRRDDLLLLYFSGHGLLDEGSRLYFAAVDTRTDRPRSTAISAAFVNELMSECHSRRQVLVLDCCNSGAFARGSKAGGSIGTGERLQGRGRVVITASDALQYAFEGTRVTGKPVQSVFTQALVTGLETGDADLNGDGGISLDELYEYVYGRVLDESPGQRPGKWSYGVEGQIFIATAAEHRDAESRPPPSTTIRRAPLPRGAMHRPRPIWAVLAVAAAAAITGAIILSGQGSGRGSPSAQPLRPPAAVSSLIDDWWRGDKNAASRVGVATPDALGKLFNRSAIEPPDKSTKPVLENGHHCKSNAPYAGYSCNYDYRPKSGGSSTVTLNIYRDATGNYTVDHVYRG